jgi:hypothetical protein
MYTLYQGIFNWHFPNGVEHQEKNINDNMAVVCLVFWGASILFSVVVVLAYIPTSSVWGFFFPASLPTFVVVCVCNDRHSNRNEWNLNVGILICISYMARDVEHFFKCFLAIWTSTFEKALFSSFAHFFIGSLIVLGSLVFWVPCIFWLSIPCQRYRWKRFSSIMWAASSS